MAKSSSTNKEPLPEFQKFLLDKNLAPEKNIPFLAYWVSRFLSFARNHELTATEYNEITVDEVKRLFEQMTGTNRLIAELLYGAGLRLMELARLRVQDIDFDSNTVFVRSGKGDKDRSTILPSAVKERLADHLKKIKAVHDKDLAIGYGEVVLPDALSRKYPMRQKARSMLSMETSNERNR